MPPIRLKILREELARARWREESFLGIVSVANISQETFRPDGPFDSITLSIFKEKNLSSDPLQIGYSLFLVAGTTPLTDEARQASCTNFLQAIRWATKRSDSVSIVRIDENFTTRFMKIAKSIAIRSPAACAVLMGITVEEAHELAKFSTDRMTIAEFAHHFDIKLRLRGERCFADTSRAPTQRALCDYLKSTSARTQRCERNRLLRTMYAPSPPLSGRPAEMASAQVLQDIRDLEQIFSELSLGETVMQRLFLLLPISQEDACSLALRLRRQKNKAVDTQNNVDPFPPDKDAKELLFQQIQGTVLDALRCRYTATDLVHVFMVAVMVSVRAQHIDVVTGHEAFWITWTEKRLRKFLQRLASGENTTNAERVRPSPQQITYTEAK